MSNRDSGKLAANILQFARTLRAAGLPVGPGRVLEAIDAARLVGVQRRDDFRACLSTVLVNHPEQRELFDQAFHVFFRNPRLLESMMSLVLPQVNVPDAVNRQPGLRRLVDIISDAERLEADARPIELEIDAALTSSEREQLQHKDFEQMSVAELAEAKEMLRRAELLFEEVRTRRFSPSRRGTRVDRRATFRRMLRASTDIIPLQRKAPRSRHPTLVLICDISGSMSRYSRLFLHFAHAVSLARQRVHTFVFATRLTNVTRCLRDRDVDRSLEQVSTQVEDWSSGTRIGECMAAFNQYWSRRVLAQGAVVILVSDGLDRGDPDHLADEMQRLRNSCRRLVWLNPLLRYAGFEPRTRGARRILPYVDELRPAHNIASLADLGDVLNCRAPRPASRPTGPGDSKNKH